VMVKPRGSVCNLACEYCYFLSKEQLFPGSSFIITEEVLDTFTRQYIQANRAPQISFNWQGGEPTLMGIDFYKKAIEYQKKYSQPGKKIVNTMQTNGTLLNDKWCEFFKDNGFLVGISLDGPPALHNIYRKDKGGKPTAAKVLKGIDLLKKHQVDFNILCTVHAGNTDHPLDVYHFFRDDLEADFIQFIPIVERDNKSGFQTGNKVTERSVTGPQYGNFLIEIFDDWVQRDVGKVFVQIFDTALGKWMGAPSGLCVFEETCGLSLALEHNGDLFSCDHYVEPKHRLGNIIKTDMIELVSSHKQYQFGMDKRSTLPKYCKECEVRFACNGGCPKNRTKHTPDNEYGLNYLCEGYKAFFKHIDQPLQIMAGLLRKNLPPANIMSQF
ncbi:MAG: anaerobic sulfatase maturase, partial [Bacteroidota bacterium]